MVGGFLSDCVEERGFWGGLGGGLGGGRGGLVLGELDGIGSCDKCSSCEFHCYLVLVVFIIINLFKIRSFYTYPTDLPVNFLVTSRF